MMTPPNMSPALTQICVEIFSFGYLHGRPPAAHLTLDLRRHFRDPHVDPQLRHMTAADEPVRHAVINTPGIAELVEATARAVDAFAAGPSATDVVVAVGCAGGRHRAPAFADALTARLEAAGHGVTVHHCDITKPVVERAEPDGHSTTVISGNTGQIHTGTGDQITNYRQR